MELCEVTKLFGVEALKLQVTTVNTRHNTVT